MPNHITTHLHIEGTQEQIAEVLEYIKGENGLIDFNKIIPMPKPLNIESGSLGERGKEYLLGRRDALDGMSEERRKEAIELGKKYLFNIQVYGFPTWYEWCNNEWGTKWNAYDCEELPDGIAFNTAWCFPAPVIETLSRFYFPEVRFRFAYADEDSSNNTGEGVLLGGEYIERYLPEGDTPDGWRLYFETHPECVDYYREKEDGTFEYIED